MKKILFIYFLIFSSFSFGQNLKKKIGDIEIQLIGHYYKRNSDYEITKRKTNKANRPSIKLFFDSNGNLLKKIKFGTNHNSSLKLIGSIEVLNYLKDSLISSLEYYSDCYCEKQIEPYYNTNYTYNKKGQLIDESTFYFNTDSLFFKTTFEYDENLNNTKSIFNPTYYYQREFDSLNRITSLKQIYDNDLRWEWKYNYSDNKRIGIFQTYYNDGKDYSKKEINTFNKKGQLIESEKKYISKLETGDKIKIYYSENGLLEKIEYYEFSSYNKEYELNSFTFIKVKSNIDLDFKLSEMINEQIEF
ncbi:hypothetical protein A9Q93_04525 [Nonlabens dokdonensis]|uniref:Uncharacterized protein n=1 Tax=Nonlabens dokdonensis TaxID=328515 RepID=A0A1Z8B648_9FLAO|nr:hypothetical protein [Nonlabens dokdonensis]OUS18033.1 hypothetical protein A9Q93_04525 [Nonlabens dokdonensis]